MAERRANIVVSISDSTVPTVGHQIAVPVDDGREWWTLGTIIRTELYGSGDRIRLTIRLAEGVELVGCVPSQESVARTED
jgi:hypothetical protein